MNFGVFMVVKFHFLHDLLAYDIVYFGRFCVTNISKQHSTPIISAAGVPEKSVKCLPRKPRDILTSNTTFIQSFCVFLLLAQIL